MAYRTKPPASWISLLDVRVAWLENCRYRIPSRDAGLGSGLHRAKLPVRWRRGETPPVARRRIQAYADGPEPASHARRKNTCNPSGRGLAARQVIHTDTRAGFHRAGGAEAAAARIHQYSMAKLRERLGRIEAGYPQRDLCTNACSVAPWYRDSVGTDKHTKILCRDKAFQPRRDGHFSHQSNAASMNSSEKFGAD